VRDSINCWNGWPLPFTVPIGVPSSGRNTWTLPPTPSATARPSAESDMSPGSVSSRVQTPSA
jgi:hypothetical protein